MGNFMVNLKLLTLSIFVSSCALAQVNSTSLFEKSKGTWNYPIEKVVKIINYEDSKSACATANACRIMSTSFIADSSYPVNAVFDGLILKIQEIDGAYAIITQFGNYFITYYGLTKPPLKEGDFVKRGQTLSNLQRYFEGNFSVDIYLSNRIETLDSFPWFVGKSCP